MNNKVGFVLCSNTLNAIPSTRIAVLNMLPFLESAGWKTSIIFEPEEANEAPNLSGVLERVVSENCNVVILQKVSGQSAVALVKGLSEFGIRSIFVICDRVDVKMASVADATVVISDYLKSLYPPELQSRIYVVHDGIENPECFKTDWGCHNDPLRSVLVTSHDLDSLPIIDFPPKWMRVCIVGRYQFGWQRLREIYWKLREKCHSDRLSYARFLMNRNITCVPWSPDTVWREMISADIGVIPILNSADVESGGLPPDWKRKSENRLTMKMSAGLPVVATPIPSYEAVINHGQNGLFASSAADWFRCLEKLRDPGLRREMGIAARLSVTNSYSKEEQAAKLIKVLNDTKSD